MTGSPILRQLSVMAGATFASLAIGCSGSSNTPVTIPASAPVVASNATWSFGVMADTQWTGVPDDGQNPNSVSVAVTDRLNNEFIAKGVKFVIQVGDLTDNGAALSLDTRARQAQALYNAGIGFFPMRGNHEASAVAAAEFQRIFPQTLDGNHNNSPADVLALTTADDANLGASAWAKTRSTLLPCGTGFSSPAANLSGLSYTFTYNNANFVVIDSFTPTDGTTANVPGQQSWIDTTLGAKPAANHAFVLTHKGLITPNHVDILFGSDPSQNAAAQNAFLSSLQANGVRYYINGHDHIHQRSQIASPDGLSKVTEITCASDSSKFYIPANPSNDAKYNGTALRETPLAQDRNTIGYYIYTVDGSKVTVDYYAAKVDALLSSGEFLMPSFSSSASFSKRESFGYHLTGKEFVVAQGGAYTGVVDGAAKILAGTNGSTLKDLPGRAFSHAVNTGWTPKTTGLLSNILTLWGMGSTLPSAIQDYTVPGNVSLASVDNVDTYCLSMAYDAASVSDALAQTGKIGIAIKGNSSWVNAVSGNTGGTPKFVFGPFSASYGLGTYGIDTATHTCWAVINFNADFAVAPSI